jgi:ectoine hydroxylase-related dioxygenase (phytanoyl-CoA dioxygenase family)
MFRLARFTLCAIVMASLPVSATELLVDHVNGYTLDNAGKLLRFDAMLVADGKVVATGRRAAIAGKAGAAEVLDGHGRTLLPGLIDAHGHVMGLGEMKIRADLTGTHSLDDALAQVRAFAPVLDADDLAHWEEHGYVVVKQAITPDECAAASAAVHAYVGADADDPSTWHAAHRRQGIMVQLFQHPALEPARTSPRIHKACAQLWNDEDLVMSTDRCGFNPPHGEHFHFPGPHLHWDAQLEPPLALGVQGILYLADTPGAQGAFTCIPGFHRGIDDWLRALPPGVDPYSRIPSEAARPIAGDAGDLILWHHALPHGSSPNRSARPRVVQYLTMYPARLA